MPISSSYSFKHTLYALGILTTACTASADTLLWDHTSNGIPGDGGNYGDFFTANNWNNQTLAQDPALSAPTAGDNLLFSTGSTTQRVRYNQSTILSLGQIDITGGDTHFLFGVGDTGFDLTNDLTLSGIGTAFEFDGQGVQSSGVDLTTLDVGGNITLGVNNSDDVSLSLSEIKTTVTGNVTVGTAGGGIGSLTLGDTDDGASLTVNGTISVEAGSTYHQQYVRHGDGLTVQSLDLGGDINRLVWDSGNITLTNSGLTVGAGGTAGATINITNDGVDRTFGDQTYTYLTSKILTLSDDLVIESGGSLSIESIYVANNSWFTGSGGYDPYTGTGTGGGVAGLSAVRTATDVVFTGNGSITLNSWGQLSADTIDLGTDGTLTLAHEGAEVSAMNITGTGGSLEWLAGTVQLRDTSNFIIGAGGPFGDTIDLTGTYDAVNTPATPGSRILSVAGDAFVASGGSLTVGESNRFVAATSNLTVQDGGTATLSGDVSPYGSLGYTEGETPFVQFIRDTSAVASRSQTNLGHMIIDDLTIDTNGTFTLSGGHLEVSNIHAAAGSNVSWTSGILQFRAGQTLDSNFILGEAVTVSSNQLLSGSFTADDVSDSIEVDGGHLRLTSVDGFAEGQIILTSGTLESDGSGNNLSIGTGQALGTSVTLSSGRRILTGPNAAFQVMSSGSLSLDGGELQTFTTDLVAAGGSFAFNSGRLVMFGQDITIKSGGLLGDNFSLTNAHTLELENRVLSAPNEGKLTISNGGALGLNGGSLKAVSVEVESGGTLTLNSGSLEAQNLSASSALTNNGANLTLTNAYQGLITMESGSLTAGTTTGLITMNGGTLTVTNINGGLEFNGGTVAANGSLSDGLDVNAAGNLSFASLAGGLTQSNASSTVSVNGPLTGDVDLTNGNLLAGSIAGNVIQDAGFIHVTTLDGSATINGGTFEAISVTGTVTNNGGTVAPGSSPAISTFGSYVQDELATLEMEIGGTTPGSTGHDQLIVTGTSDLAGILEIVLIDLGSGIFAPQEGDTFVLFDLQGSVTGWFDTINLPELAEGLSWINNLPTTGTLEVVPEPSSYAIIIGLMALSVTLVRRRK